MEIPKQFIKPFPEYEEVFYENLEQHKKHFLPVCSINLQCVDPEWNEWLHIVSAKEIYDGCVGESARKFHTAFTKEDMLGFDVIEGQYRFEADWRYFDIEQNSAELEDEAYKRNETDYKCRKEYFQRNQKLYPYSSFSTEFTSVEEIEKDFKDKQASGWGLNYPEVNGILNDVRLISEEGQGMLEDCDHESDVFEYTNLVHVPKDADGQPFTYIGTVTGYYFQAYGADRIFLFFNKELKKAVICFEYT